MTLYELRLLIDGLLSSEAVQARFVPGLELVAHMISPLYPTQADAEPEDDADDADDAEDDDDDDDDAAPEKAAEFRRGWDDRIIKGEPGCGRYYLRRASDDALYYIDNRVTSWTKDPAVAKVSQGIRSAAASALGVSTYVGRVDVVDVDSGEVVRAYEARRRVL